MPTDRILLEGILCYGHHGVAPEEKKLGQRFVVDLEVERELRQAGRSDELADTVDYRIAHCIVREVLEGPSRNLLENLAETIASRILRELPAEAVRVRIKKPGVPIEGGNLAHAGVEIYRKAE